MRGQVGIFINNLSEEVVMKWLMKRKFQKKIFKLSFVLSLLAGAVNTFLFNSTAHASATGLPWEGPLQGIANSLTGPVAQIAGIVAVTIFGIGLAFSEGGTFMRKALMVCLGLAIAFAASSWAISFFGFSGGLMI
jgi:type IV secretion system protein TrbC